MLDDRGERPGAMFADWELIGVPHRVVISDRGLKDGTVEVPGPARRAGHARCRWPRCAAFVKGRLGGMSGARRGPRAARLLGAGAAGALAAAWPRRRAPARRSRSRWPTRCARALAAAIADSAPPQAAASTRIEDRLAYLRWLGAMSERLKQRKSRARARASSSSRRVWYESKRAGLEPALVLGLIQVESGFRKYAISTAGARGYMQVMPFWARADRRRRRRRGCSTCRPTCASAA